MVKFVLRSGWDISKSRGIFRVMMYHDRITTCHDRILRVSR